MRGLARLTAAVVFFAKCSALWLVLGAGLPSLGRVAVVAAHVVAPPLAATLVGVCGGQPCLVLLPVSVTVTAAPTPPLPSAAQARSRKRVMRRST